MATNKENRWFFVFGFQKNVRANVNKKELEALQDLAADLLRLDMKQLDAHVSNKSIQEICLDDEN